MNEVVCGANSTHAQHDSVFQHGSKLHLFGTKTQFGSQLFQHRRRQQFPMMQDFRQVNRWQSQSEVTRVGSSSAALNELPSDLHALRGVSQELVAHYMGTTFGTSGPVKGERLREVDLRYADLMFSKLLNLGSPILQRKRPTEERIVGCCRDFALLFVAMARHKEIPARVRVGYATYFKPGWFIDHVIAEVWDDKAKLWKLIEPEISDTLGRKIGVDPLDVSSDQFVTGPRAWQLARSGQIDSEKFVVMPDLQIPYTRGWLSLRHHIVQDLVALNKVEMLVWDQWGILNEDDPLRRADLLDRLASITVESNCPVEELSKWARIEGLRVPKTITSYSPTQETPLTVDVSRALEGLI